MTGADITSARAQLARLWGLPRPLTAAQLGRILQIDRRDPGATVRQWETGRHPPPGPVRVALALMLAGARPEGAPVAPEAPPAPEPVAPAPPAASTIAAPLTRRRGSRAPAQPPGGTASR